MTVIPLHGGPAPSDPVPDVVALAQSLLDRARSGELRALAVATVTGPDVGIDTEYVGSGGTVYALGAATMVLHGRVQAWLVER